MLRSQILIWLCRWSSLNENCIQSICYERGCSLFSIYFNADSFITYTQAIGYLLLGLAIFYSESTGKFNLPYSKFAGNSGISPRLGMFLIYFFPILGFGFAISPEKLKHFSVILLAIAVILHFAKRCFESLFLHIYSGKIGLIAVVLISFAYTNLCILIATKTNELTDDYLSGLPAFQMASGVLLFLVGETGNLWHHILLRRLRSPKKAISSQNSSPPTSSYQVPHGGLFSLLVCPHYSFELIAWLGISFLSGHWEVFAIFGVMTFYLAGRSTQTQKWYLQNTPGFPIDRRRIIPFLF